MPAPSADGSDLRRLHPQWDKAMIAASIAISFLGAFTSTQLMCHARMSLHFSSVLIWSLAGSVIFGFCSVWSLHEVAMLAYELDLRIGVDAPLTVLSSILAVAFTFVALSNDLLWDRWQNRRHNRRKSRTRFNRHRIDNSTLLARRNTQGTTPLLPQLESDEGSENLHDEENDHPEDDEPSAILNSGPPTPTFAANQEELSAFVHTISRSSVSSFSSSSSGKLRNGRPNSNLENEEYMPTEDVASEPNTRPTSDDSFFGLSSTAYASSGGLSTAMGLVYRRSTGPAKNAFVATARLLCHGCTKRTIGKGFLWSLAVTSMHYVGIRALKVPRGYVSFNIWLVLLSALISWTVCTGKTISF